MTFCGPQSHMASTLSTGLVISEHLFHQTKCFRNGRGKSVLILVWTITCGHFSCPFSHHLLSCLHLPCLGDLQKGQERERRQRNREGPFPGQSSQRHLNGAQKISGYFSSPLNSFLLKKRHFLLPFVLSVFDRAENGIYIQTKVWDSILTWWKDRIITQVLGGCWWPGGLQVKGFNSRVSLW